MPHRRVSSDTSYSVVSEMLEIALSSSASARTGKVALVNPPRRCSPTSGATVTSLSSLDLLPRWRSSCLVEPLHLLATHIPISVIRLGTKTCGGSTRDGNDHRDSLGGVHVLAPKIRSSAL